MSLLAVTVLGHDRPGIVADTTAALAELGGNLEDSTMTLLRGHFAMLLLVRTPQPADDVARALDGLTADGRLTVDVREVPDLELGAATSGPGRPYLLSVHGADRPGIVGALTGVVAGARGNVTDLTTRLSGDLYVLLADVTLPDDADPDLVERALRTTADELGVDVSWRPVDADEL
ncbi:amino acid-binding protein [Angustibacter peucedani]